VRDVAHGGDAVVETEAGLVMVRGPLPGERVRVALSGRRGGVARGELLKLIEPSPARVEPACAIAGRCGGCPLMALSQPEQLELKRRRVARALSDGPAPEVRMHSSPASLGYRGRARLSFVRAGGGLQLGYRAAASNRVVDAPGCPILGAPLAAALAPLRATLGMHLQGKGELSLAEATDGRAVAHLRCEAPQPPELYATAEELVADSALAGITLSVQDTAPARFGDPRPCSPGADGLPMWSAPGGFAQANPALNRLLRDAVIELAEPHGCDVLELYSGHGNFTVELARRARRVVAVESDRPATEACRENLALRGLEKKVRVRCDAAEEAASGGGPLELVVLDPPRNGAREALQALLPRRPKRVVYVSCDPSTLRRDLAALRDAGMEVDAARAFDMFPHTPHVEAVVRLTRASAS
jgi:23S rRNA (uracil1939-C5)-methyltransferase